MIIRSNTKQAIDQYQEKCPFCLNVLNQPILTYIDCDKQPDLKYEAICGHLLHSRCPHCGSQIPLSQPLTYEDKLNHTILYFEPDDQKRSSLNKTLQKEISERKIRFKKTFYRILKRREDFYEKSRILDCSLDDRLIELMKIYIVQFFSIERNQNVSSIRFQLQKDRPVFLLDINEAKGIFGFSTEDYDLLKNAVKTLEQMDPALCSEHLLHVDSQWAVETFPKVQFLLMDPSKSSDLETDNLDELCISPDGYPYGA